MIAGRKGRKREDEDQRERARKRAVVTN